LKKEDFVSVEHYSMREPCKVKVFRIEDDTYKLVFPKDILKKEINPDDPMVIGQKKSKKISTYGAQVLDVDNRKSTVDIKLDLRKKLTSDKRFYQRYPVSLYASIKTTDAIKRELCYIKDMSIFGMKLFSEFDFMYKDRVIVDIYSNDDIMSQEGEIVQKHKLKKNWIYGIKVKHTLTHSFDILRAYLNDIDNRHSKSFKKPLEL
jgi:hypothetical protein